MWCFLDSACLKLHFLSPLLLSLWCVCCVYWWGGILKGGCTSWDCESVAHTQQTLSRVIQQSHWQARLFPVSALLHSPCTERDCSLYGVSRVQTWWRSFFCHLNLRPRASKSSCSVCAVFSPLSFCVSAVVSCGARALLGADCRQRGRRPSLCTSSLVDDPQQFLWLRSAITDLPLPPFSSQNTRSSPCPSLYIFIFRFFKFLLTLRG